MLKKFLFFTKNAKFAMIIIQQVIHLFQWKNRQPINILPKEDMKPKKSLWKKMNKDVYFKKSSIIWKQSHSIAKMMAYLLKQWASIYF